MEKVLSVPDLESIKTFIHSFLSNHDRITTSDLYQNIKSKLISQYDEAIFKVQISKAIKEGVLGNLTIVRGPHGGIKFAIDKPEVPVVINKDSVEVSKTLIQKMTAFVEDVTEEPPKVKPYFSSLPPVVKPPPPVVVNHTIYLKGVRYHVPLELHKIKALLNNVLEVVEYDGGTLEFEGVKYTCSEEQLNFLDKLLFFFYGASYEVGENHEA